MTNRRARPLALVTVVLGCGSGGPDLPVAALLEIVATSNNQSAAAGDRLARPLAVRVLTSDGVTVVPREEIAWDVVTGAGATLSDAITAADGTGEAQVTVTLGPETGSYDIRAALAARPSVSVTFTAVASTPPRLSGVTPATFAAGDTLLLSGTGLDGPLTVEIGGVPAEVVGGSVTETALSVVAPACLVPGPVSVTASIGLSASTVSATYEASGAVLALAPAAYLSVDPVALDGCATFPTAGATGAEYLLAPQSVTGTPGVTSAFRLRGDSVVTPVAVPQPEREARPVALTFHDFLREREAELSREPRLPFVPELGPGLASADITLGSTRSFEVCNVVTCSAEEDFTTVTAEAKYVGEHAVLYLDRTAPTGLTATDFDTLGVLFDREVYGVATRAFGAESDVDRNGRVFILLTPVVNALTPVEQCSTSFILGFFFPIDTDPTRAEDPRSNQAEVFYGIVPDPQGTVTCSHSVDRVRRLVPVNFIHEFQHLINFYQHVILRASGAEVTWLNEAMSHLAEDMAGRHFLAAGDTLRANAFIAGDFLNAFMYLSGPQAHFPIFSEGTGSLEERGAGWLFLRWLVDRFGPETVRRLSETGQSGAQNVVTATGRPMARLLAEWFLANYVSDLPDFMTPASLRYTTWNFRQIYQSLHAALPGQFDRPFPIVPFAFTGGTFDISGTIRSGTGEYVIVTQQANQRGFTARLLDAGGNPLAGAAVPRLNVIRLR